MKTFVGFGVGTGANILARYEVSNVLNRDFIFFTFINNILPNTICIPNGLSIIKGRAL